MGQVEKILVTEEGNFDLRGYRLDDRRLSDMLVKETAINADQAREIIRLLREEISNM